MKFRIRKATLEPPFNSIHRFDGNGHPIYLPPWITDWLNLNFMVPMIAFIIIIVGLLVICVALTRRRVDPRNGPKDVYCRFQIPRKPRHLFNLLHMPTHKMDYKWVLNSHARTYRRKIERYHSFSHRRIGANVYISKYVLFSTLNRKLRLFFPATHCLTSSNWINFTIFICGSKSRSWMFLFSTPKHTFNFIVFSPRPKRQIALNIVLFLLSFQRLIWGYKTIIVSVVDTLSTFWCLGTAHVASASTFILAVRNQSAIFCLTSIKFPDGRQTAIKKTKQTK